MNTTRARCLPRDSRSKLYKLQINVPTIGDSESAREIEETILISEPEAKVEVDFKSKIVTIESKASEETFRELIVAAGHEID
ncbi:MAG TPA: heavy metal transport/detoxification protein [Xenococcaceae cyanobacterium]